MNFWFRSRFSFFFLVRSRTFLGFAFLLAFFSFSLCRLFASVDREGRRTIRNSIIFWLFDLTRKMKKRRQKKAHSFYQERRRKNFRLMIFFCVIQFLCSRFSVDLILFNFPSSKHWKTRHFVWAVKHPSSPLFVCILHLQTIHERKEDSKREGKELRQKIYRKELTEKIFFARVDKVKAPREAFFLFDRFKQLWAWRNQCNPLVR